MLLAFVVAVGVVHVGAYRMNYICGSMLLRTVKCVVVVVVVILGVLHSTTLAYNSPTAAWSKQVVQHLNL